MTDILLFEKMLFIVVFITSQGQLQEGGHAPFPIADMSILTIHKLLKIEFVLIKNILYHNHYL